MKYVFYLLMIILFIIAGGLLLLVFIRYFVTYNKFRDYLIGIDDKDTLRKIGRLNSIDQPIFATIPFPKVHKTMLEKYKTTNDDKYLLFDEQYMRCIRQMSILAVLLFLLFVIYQIIF